MKMNGETRSTVTDAEQSDMPEGWKKQDETT
jgi:hypothetical protein